MRDKIEAAIKLLQGQGYEVFNRSAAIHLRAQRAEQVGRFVQYKDDTGYQQSVRAELGRLIEREMQRVGLIEFSNDAALADGDKYGFLPFTVVTRGNLEVFPAVRKEWRR